MGRKGYLAWLLKIAVPERKTRRLYSKTFNQLLETEFYYTIRNDDNRMYNGLNLRVDYCEDCGGKWDKWLANAPCSLLEVMVGLAISAENTMHDEDFGDRTGVWFWAMMDNSGLSEWDNVVYEEEKVAEICDTIMARTYESDGKGGLFRVPKSWGDLRRVELWYQMNWWLTENVLDL